MGYRRAHIEQLPCALPACDRAALTNSLATLTALSGTTLRGETFTKAISQAGWLTVATPAEHADSLSVLAQSFRIRN